MCTCNRDYRKLENTVMQSRFKHLVEEWTEAGVSASRVTAVRHLQEQDYQATSETETVRSILPGLRRKITGLLLSGPKSSFQMKVNLAFNLEIKVPESGGREERHRIHVAWSPVWSFHSLWWFGLPCHLLLLVHCVFCSVNAAIYQDILEHFLLPSPDKPYGDADFIFQQDLTPAHSAKGTKSWFSGHGVTVLDWPANSPDSKEDCRGWETPDPTMQIADRYQSNLRFHYTWAVPQTDCLHATPHWCNTSCKIRPNQVLSV